VPQDILGEEGGFPPVPFPAIFGHEGAGVIRQLGVDVKDKSLKVGDTVILSFNSCGFCKSCEVGFPGSCFSHTHLNQRSGRMDGTGPATLSDKTTAVSSQFFGQSSFAKMTVVCERCVVKCDSPPSLVPFYYAGLGCGFQTGAGTILNALQPKKSDSVAIFGLGSVGMAAVMAAKYMGIQTVIAIDLAATKTKLAAELGASHTINPTTTPDVAREIQQLTNGNGVDYLLECTGATKVLDGLVDCLSCRGTAALIGVPPVGSEIKLDTTRMLLENKMVRGVVQGDSIAQNVCGRKGNPFSRQETSASSTQY
jgi:Zn-dependent alcohol dehydrogenase